VAQVAPTGFAAVIDEHGNVLERSQISEQIVIQRSLELREGLTIYTRFGNLAAVSLALLLIAAGWAVELTRSRRHGARDGAAPAEATVTG
jgi:apolipoprotein N-acyltransferase